MKLKLFMYVILYCFTQVNDLLRILENYFLLSKIVVDNDICSSKRPTFNYLR